MNTKKLEETSQIIREIQSSYKKILISKDDKENKETQKKELVQTLFDLIPGILNKYDVESFISQYGKNEKDLASQAILEYTMYLLAEAEGEVEENYITETILVPNGKMKKVVIKDAEGEDTNDFIEIPDFEEKTIKYLSIGSINNLINTDKVKEMIDNSHSKILGIIKKVVSFEDLTVKLRNGEEFNLNLGLELKNKSLVDYYTSKTLELLKVFHDANGLVTETRMKDVEKRITLPNGDKANKIVQEPYNVLVLRPNNHSLFSSFLLNPGLKHSGTGKPINIYTEWETTLLNNITKQLPVFLEKNKTINDESSNNLYDLFVKALDGSVDSLKENYKTITDNKLYYNVPKNFFARNRDTITEYLTSGNNRNNETKPFGNAIPVNVLNNEKFDNLTVTNQPNLISSGAENTKEVEQKALPSVSAEDKLMQEKFEKMKSRFGA